ncbi:hypothetical protein IV203_020680 [Nitzschia inconspicua]|uniref:Uncharacterized protein n=1 Tax=Nitzschia inconspicua TaxID=303405 RepID=A0A9K3KGI3_9STRA|nr:hypothetical protein IV203_020680 [Nitzschia inconspicua]
MAIYLLSYPRGTGNRVPTLTVIEKRPTLFSHQHQIPVRRIIDSHRTTMKLFVSFVALAFLVADSDLIDAKQYADRSIEQEGKALLYGAKCKEWPHEGYFYVEAVQNVYKIGGKGQRETTPAPFLDFDFSFMSNCDGETGTKIQADWDLIDTSAGIVSLPSNLRTGSASGSFPALEIPCTLILFDDGADSPRLDCDRSAARHITVDMSITWTGTGSPQQSSENCSMRNDHSFFSTSTKVSKRDTTFDLSLKIDAVPVDLSNVFSEATDTYSWLMKTIKTEVSKVKN